MPQVLVTAEELQQVSDDAAEVVRREVRAGMQKYAEMVAVGLANDGG